MKKESRIIHHLICPVCTQQVSLEGKEKKYFLCPAHGEVKSPKIVEEILSEGDKNE